MRLGPQVRNRMIGWELMLSLLTWQELAKVTELSQFLRGNKRQRKKQYKRFMREAVLEDLRRSHQIEKAGGDVFADAAAVTT